VRHLRRRDGGAKQAHSSPREGYVTDPALCSICRREPARPGLRTGESCARRYAEANRARAERRRAEEARRRVEMLKRRRAAARVTIEAKMAAPPPGAPPVGFRVAEGTRYAVDGGWRAMRRGADGVWRPVDLDAAPLVQRAMSALVTRAWGERAFGGDPRHAP
jgi:hypothetical protein